MSKLLQLWRALINTPQTSPIFRRAFMLSRRYMQVMDVPELPPINLWEGFQKFLTRIISILGGVGFLIGVACLLPFVALLTVTSAFVYGIRCAVQTSGNIANERERKTYDLLCVLPQGQFGINWSVCATHIRRYENFETFRQIFRGLTYLLIIGVVLLIAIILMNLGDTPSSTRNYDGVYSVIQNGTHLIAISIGLYLNFMQSVVVGSLIGIIVPTYTENRLDAQMYSVMGFMTIQVFVYALSLFLSLMVAPLLILNLQLTVWLETGTQAWTLLIIFGMITEILTRILWIHARHRLHPESSEIQTIHLFASWE